MLIHVKTDMNLQVKADWLTREGKKNRKNDRKKEKRKKEKKNLTKFHLASAYLANAWKNSKNYPNETKRNTY